MARIPPPPQLAKDQQGLNRWLLDLTAILNGVGNSTTFDGTVTVPTQPPGTNTEQIASTAFVLANSGGVPSSTVPLVDATPGQVGVSTHFARGDHVHPTDTSRAALASPTFTGTPTAPTPAPGDNTTTLATTAFVEAAVATTRVKFTGSAVNGAQTINQGVNVASVTRTGIGAYSIVFSTAFPNANYVCLGANNGGTTDGWVEFITQAPGSVVAVFISKTAAQFDPVNGAYLAFI